VTDTVGERRAGAGPGGRWSGPERRQTATPLHFRRFEFKYVVPERFVAELVDRISPYTDWDPFVAAQGRTSYPVTSLYFDSFNLQSLFAKEAGWLSRRRIRLRTYEETLRADNTMFFEIKRRHDSLVSKDRLPLSLGEGEVAGPANLRQLLGLTRDRRRDVVDEARTLDAWYNLQPTALVSYDRVAFVGKADRKLRLTFDRDLKGVWRPWTLGGDMPYRRCGIHPILPRLMSYGAHQSRGPNPLEANSHVIFELKFSEAVPAWLHRIVMDMNLVRSAYSKYAFVVRDLRPNLFDAHDDAPED
jgi:hypothetical protein